MVQLREHHPSGVDSIADAIVVLAPTECCNEQGTVCTGDGRKLSNRQEFTVSGPDGLSGKSIARSS